MSALCSIQDNRILHLNSIVCVYHVAASGEAVNSNNLIPGRKRPNGHPAMCVAVHMVQ